MYSHQCTVKCTVLDFIVMCLPCRLHKPDPRPTPLPAPTKGLFAGMSKEHIRPRSDYITALALARTHAENQSGSRPHPKPDVPTHLRKPSMIIPDLRFEPTYLAKLAAADPGWQSVIWVTIRDQVISPLLQGALWGTATVFIQPLIRSVFGLRSHSDSPKPAKEGSAASWLRQWARSLFFPDARAGSSSAGIR